MSLDDLSSDPLPVPGPSPATQEYLDYLTMLLEDEQYAYAAATLEGIRTTITRTCRISMAQREAVQRIIAGAEFRHDRPRGGSRRYEGFGR